MKTIKNIVVIFVIFTQSVFAQNFNNIVREGAQCELSTKEKGICIRLSLCSSARELIKQQKIPENCGNINSIPITCCPKKPRKIVRLAERKCKYVELSRFGFIADALSTESYSPANEYNSYEVHYNYPFRIEIPTAEHKIPQDFSRFPLEEEIENKYHPKDEKSNLIPMEFSRIPTKDIIHFEDEDPDIITFEDEDFEEKNTKIAPFSFSRFGFNEDETVENLNTKQSFGKNGRKFEENQNKFQIPIDFSRFGYSPTDDVTQRQKQDNLIQFEPGLLPNLDLSSKDISDLIIRETPNFVLGGQNAKIREFPHMAALGFENNNEKLWLCGGSLISDQYVLTAAHCLSSLDYGPLAWIRLGDINRDSSFQTKHQDFRVEKAIPHPLYHPSSTYHDIALVKMNHKAVINNFVNTACLFTEEKIPPSLELWATGWGLTTEGGNHSDILQKVELNLFSEEECNQVYKESKQIKNGILQKQQICAGGRINQKDTCKGDSGGPLQIRMSRDDGDIFYIAGITSFGKQCGNKNIPAIYTRVSFYISWIENIIWPGEQ